MSRFERYPMQAKRRDDAVAALCDGSRVLEERDFDGGVRDLLYQIA